jgi:hypothetical protein
MSDTKELPQMDWQQVVLNGGPPCFHVEGPQFCGRAERWPGHDNPAFHKYVSLPDFIRQAIADEREACAGIAENYGKGMIFTAASAGVIIGTKDKIAALIRASTTKGK